MSSASKRKGSSLDPSTKRRIYPTDRQNEPDILVETSTSWRARPTYEFHDVNTLDDLLDLAWNYTGDAFDSFRLWKMIPSLTRLASMIGMEKIKQSVVSLTLTYLQDLHLLPDGSLDTEEMLHTAITGKPGCGKTTVAEVLAQIYCDLGAVKTNKITKVKRADLIGKYIGHTEDHTKKLLDSAVGGILYIDEAYSLGQEERVESFSKAAIDMITAFLTEHTDCICIIAGYPDELENCFFRVNQGLDRRFTRRMQIDPYGPEELFQIFDLHVTQKHFSLVEADRTRMKAFFHENRDQFPYSGGDLVNLIGKCKEAHARRIFGLSTKDKRTFSIDDLDAGMKLYRSYRKSTQRSGPPPGMFG